MCYKLHASSTDELNGSCRETMAAIGGMYVLNSGTLLGPSQGLGQYFRLMMREFERRWHCRRLHGSDQVVHNYMVYTGKLIGSGAFHSFPSGSISLKGMQQGCNV